MATITLPRRIWSGPHRVEVRVSIDERGKVTRADIVHSGPLPAEVTRAVLDAARKWTFEPARPGEPVAGVHTIHFQFR